MPRGRVVQHGEMPQEAIPTEEADVREILQRVLATQREQQAELESLRSTVTELCERLDDRASSTEPVQARPPPRAYAPPRATAGRHHNSGTKFVKVERRSSIT